MTLARVVTFEGVSTDRMDELKREMQSGEPPVDIPAQEVIMLHDPEAGTSIALVFFENEDDYRRGDEALNAMPSDGTPGRRASVGKYEVAVHFKR